MKAPKWIYLVLEIRFFPLFFAFKALRSSVQFMENDRNWLITKFLKQLFGLGLDRYRTKYEYLPFMRSNAKASNKTKGIPNENLMNQ
jgi:hypothetical protein